MNVGGITTLTLKQRKFRLNPQTTRLGFKQRKHTTLIEKRNRITKNLQALFMAWTSSMFAQAMALLQKEWLRQGLSCRHGHY